MKTAAIILTVLVSTAVPAQAQEPTTGYAPVNGLEMYYEIHGTGNGEPLVLLHGSFMTITNNWTGWIDELSKTRKVVAVEMQGHGRTADIDRDFSYAHLADDIAALLDYLEIPQADVLGYSMGGGVAMQVAIRHPEKVRKVVSISAVFRHDGWVEEALEMFPQLTADMFAGSPLDTDYKKLSPTPGEFPNFVRRVIAMDLKPYDFGADKLAATTAPFLFIHGDADGVRLDHIVEMFRLKGGDVFGDLRPRSESRLAVLPNTTHITLMEKADVIIPMVNDFLNAESQQEVRSARSPEHATTFVGLRTAIYHVGDLDAAKAWYTEALAVAPYFDESFYVGFDVGGFELGLDPDTTEAKPGPGGTVAYWGVVNADFALAHLLRVGARPNAAVQDVGGGVRVASVLDPFGNVLGIIESPVPS